jgi:hypothetical protein
MYCRVCTFKDSSITESSQTKAVVVFLFFSLSDKTRGGGFVIQRSKCVYRPMLKMLIKFTGLVSHTTKLTFLLCSIRVGYRGVSKSIRTVT